MRSMLFLSLIIASAAACTTEEPPEAYLPAYYDLTLTLEEEVCGSDVQHPYWVQDGALHADSSVSTPGAVDLWLLAGDWGHTFNGVQVSEDGSFESWSLYAFVRDGEVIAPLFMVLEGSATQYGLDARLTEYYSDGSNNDWAVPDCRYVWQVQSR